MPPLYSTSPPAQRLDVTTHCNLNNAKTKLRIATLSMPQRKNTQFHYAHALLRLTSPLPSLTILSELDHYNALNCNALTVRNLTSYANTLRVKTQPLLDCAKLNFTITTRTKLYPSKTIQTTINVTLPTQLRTLQYNHFAI